MDPATVRTQSSVRCMDTRTPSVVARRRLRVGIHQLESSDAKVTARVSTRRNEGVTFGAGLRSAEEDGSAFRGEEDALSRRERMHRYASSTCYDSHGSERTDANDCDEGFLPYPASLNSGTREREKFVKARRGDATVRRMESFYPFCRARVALIDSGERWSAIEGS